ncbi:WXG100 family type VII secretion target [Amycolatopsis sp. lyj-109]|uniref:WXG100 family type VII secretion target n=1 Tax=Amycolatopsis sp. lyj-109 TaxID=2789287 RepID=UPI0039787C6E
MTENALVTEAKKKVDEGSSALEGAGMAQDFWDAAAKAADDDWTEGLLNLGFGAAGVMEFVQDPIAGLASMGLGWLIEHVEVLRAPLDWVTGNQEQLDVMQETWSGISDEIDAVAKDLLDTVKADSAEWQGQGADAYRAFTAELGDMYSGVAGGAKAISVLIDVCKSILNVVRSVLRDLLTECIGKLISILLRYPGPAAPAGVAGEGTAEIVKCGRRMSEWLQKLVRAFRKGISQFNHLSGLFRTVGQKLLAALQDAARAAPGIFKNGIQELPKALGEEAGKEAGKKAAGGYDEADKEYRENHYNEKKPEAVFQQQGGRRISGSI